MQPEILFLVSINHEKSYLGKQKTRIQFLRTILHHFQPYLNFQVALDTLDILYHGRSNHQT